MLTIVFPRTFADLDGVACAVAYAELLTRMGHVARPWLPSECDTEAEFALKRCGGVILAESSDFQSDTRFILVDACDLDGFPPAVSTTQVVEVIDHRQHGDPRRFFPNATIRIEPVGAAATIIVEQYRVAQIVPASSSAELLYGAIHSNTQELKGSVTTERDVAAASWLEAAAQIPAGFLDEQFAARRSDIVADLEAFVLRESKQYPHSSGAFVIAQLEFRGAGDFSLHEQSRLIKALAPLGVRAMLNMVDLVTGSSYLLVPDTELRKLVSKALSREDNGIAFEFHPSVLRKQIVAALKV